MAAPDFPASPTVGQTYTAPSGNIYKWDGSVWTTSTVGGPVVQVAPAYNYPLPSTATGTMCAFNVAWTPGSIYRLRAQGVYKRNLGTLSLSLNWGSGMGVQSISDGTTATNVPVEWQWDQFIYVNTATDVWHSTVQSTAGASQISTYSGYGGTGALNSPGYNPGGVNTITITTSYNQSNAANYSQLTWSTLEQLK